MIRRLLATVAIAALTLAGPAAGAQGLEADIAAAVADRGWWDETSSLDPARLDALVDRHDGRYAFGFTDRSFTVDADANIAAAPVLAQAVLDAVVRSGMPVETVIIVDGSGAGGASVAHAYRSVVLALDALDRSDVVSSFGVMAASLEDGSAQPAPFEATADSDEGSTFTFGRVLVLVLIVAAMAVLWTIYTSRRKSTRTASTAGARDDTKFELTAMSDLILDLEPRIVIASDAGLRERFAAATRTYSEVMERAESVTGGHEVADLRIAIAKARWKLDVIAAELDGVEAPPEPFTRDVSGSAWDSTRGTGGGAG